jgi:membrane associated rhomboid family serine protease
MFTTIVQQTPHWVWGVFAALTVLGCKQSVPRRRSLRSATALPVAMALLSLYGVASAFSSQPLALLAWVTGVAVALALSQGLRVWDGIRWLESERSVLMPGSWLPLVLLLGLFLTKYAAGVALSINPELAAEASTAGFVGLVYGAFSGVFLSRALAVWRAVRQTLPPDSAY